MAGESPDDAKKEQIQDHLKILDDQLQRQKSNYVIGNIMCAADVTLACALNMYM